MARRQPIARAVQHASPKATPHSKPPERVSVRRASLASVQELTPGESESSLRQQIIFALRRAIELGALRAGDRLVEKDLCAKFRVSRTSLREALRELGANGVVTKVSARTLIVTPVAPQDAINMARVRASIEMMLAEQFVKLATQDDIADLAEALEKMRAAEEPGVALDAHREYYRIWCRAVGNEFALHLLMNIQLRLSAIRSRGLQLPDLRLKNIGFQSDIFACMARRDAKAAQALICRHNRHSTLAMIEATKKQAPRKLTRRTEK